MRCQFSSGPKLLLSGPMPALFIRISVPPNRFCTAACSPATSSKRLTSTEAVMTSAAPPFAADASVAAAPARRSSPISAMQTFMPRPAKRVAAASPMPEAPPVMTATLFGDMAGWGEVTLRIDQDPRTLQACSPHAIVLMRVRNSDGKQGAGRKVAYSVVYLAISQTVAGNRAPRRASPADTPFHHAWSAARSQCSLRSSRRRT